MEQKNYWIFSDNSVSGWSELDKGKLNAPILSLLLTDVFYETWISDSVDVHLWKSDSYM